MPQKRRKIESKIKRETEAVKMAKDVVTKEKEKVEDQFKVKNISTGVKILSNAHLNTILDERTGTFKVRLAKQDLSLRNLNKMTLNVQNLASLFQLNLY